MNEFRAALHRIVENYNDWAGAYGPQDSAQAALALGRAIDAATALLAPSEKTEGQLQAQAWITWLETKQAKICTQDYANGPYLENRLWAAFIAGYEAALPQTRITREEAEKLLLKFYFSKSEVFGPETQKIADDAEESCLAAMLRSD